ncbi:MAG: hypothetical protein FJ279_07385, partial [Planctomycetes bacterium]|nr:hypothetical protein [Planctomycetota bacterium]
PVKEDWFRFETVGQGVTGDEVRIEFEHLLGDLDLALYDGTGVNRLALSASTQNAESVSLQGLAAGAYYVQVLGYNGAVNPGYTLTIDAPLAATGEDWAEQNDSRDAAYDLRELSGSHVFDGLTMDDSANEPTRVDWFKFQTVGQGRVGDQVRIDFQNVLGDLDLSVYDAGDRLVSSSATRRDYESVSLLGLPAGTYYAKVFGRRNATNPSYTLTIDAPVSAIGEDWAEQNDAAGAPYDLRELEGHGFVFDGLTMDDTANEPAKEDWFVFQTVGEGVADDQVRIDFTHALGDLDLALYDVNQALLGTSQSVNNSETISLNRLAAGTYYVQVYGHGGATNPDYKLTIDAPMRPVGIPEDWAEQNDAAGAAYNLRELEGPGYVFTGLTMDDSVNEPAKDDWFVFQTVGAGVTGDQVRIDFEHALGDLDLALYDAAQSLLRQSAGVGDSETIGLSMLPAGTYYVRVLGFGGATNPDYKLTIDAPVRSVGIPEDWAEQNDTLAGAYDLRELEGHGQLFDGLTMDDSANEPTKDDWFMFETVGEGVVGDQVRIDFAQALGDLDLELYDAGRNLIGESATADDSETISLFRMPAGTYYVRVLGYEGAANPDYKLGIDAPARPVAIPEDWAEQNDAADAAYDLRELEGHGYLFTDLTMDDSANEPTREDWFMFQTVGEGVVGDRVSIQFRHAQGDLDLALYNSARTILRTSASVEDSEAVSLHRLAAGTYYVRVYGHGGDTNPDYKLAIDAPERPAGIPEDWAEQNDASTAAFDLRELAGHGYVFTGLTMDDSANEPAKDDWFAFQTVGLGVVGDQVRIDFTHALGDLDMALYDAGLRRVGASSSVGNSEVIGLRGLAAGTYYLQVLGHRGATNPDYTLNIDAPELPVAIAEDWAEQNDSSAAAYTLRELAGHGYVFDGLTMDDSVNEPTKADWFVFQTAGEGVLGDEARIDFTHALGDLDLALYNATLGLVGRSQSVGNSEAVSLQGLPTGTYYVHVYGYGGATNPGYTLAINAPEPTANVPEDWAEQNDAREAAYDFRQLEGHGYVFSGLTMDDSANELAKSDWFMFQTSARGVPGDQVRIDFTHALGDLDLSLHDGLGNLLASSLGVSDFEAVSLDGLAAGTYYVQVNGFSGATNPDYTLTIDAPYSAPVADPYELNETQETAYDLRVLEGPGYVYTGMSIEPTGDEDWFQFTTTADGGPGDRVRIEFTHELGDVDLELYEQGGALLRGSYGMGDGERVSLAGLIPGAYFVRIYGFAGATNPTYTMEIDAPQAAAADDPTIAQDWAEQNDALGAAYDLRALDGHGHVFTDLTMDDSAEEPTKADWFMFQTASDGVSGDQVRIDFAHDLGDLDLVLFDHVGTPVAASLGVEDSETVSLDGMAAGTYYVAVLGYAGATNPSYTLSIDAPTTGDGIPRDTFEANDSFGEAANLRTLVGRGHEWDNLTVHQTGNDDWYQFTIAQDGAAGDNVRIEFSHDSGDLGLELYDGTQTRVGQSNGATDIESISLDGVAAGTYSARVFGAANPDYSLRIDAPTAAGARGNWTVLVYVDGDNNLEGAAIDDLNEMEAVALPEGVSVAVLLDRIPGEDSSNGNWTDTRQGLVIHDANPFNISSSLTSLGEQNMGDPATLESFIRWGVAAYPADNYALVVWDHGGGLDGVAWDDTDGADNLTIPELTAAVTNAGTHFGVIGFDVCLAGLFTQAYDLRSLTDVVVASEQLEPGDGWDYTGFLTQMAANPAMTAEEVGAAIVGSYGAFYGNSQTLSATRVSSYGSLATALTGFADAVLADATDADWNRIVDARNATPYYAYQYYRDLGAFMANVSGAVPTPSLIAAANNVSAAYAGAIVANHSGTSEGATGLSIYLPGPGGSMDPGYEATNYDLVADTHWRSFVEALTLRTPRAPVAGDWAERNNVRAESADLHSLAGPGLVFENLSIHESGNDDWFRFETLADGTAADNVQIAFTHADGNLDLELYDATGALLTSSTSTTDSEQVSLEGRAAGQYFIRVFGLGGAVNPSYTLTINAPATPRVSEDWAEPNDSREKANDL